MDDLAGRAAVVAVVGRRPSPRHVVVLRARAGRGHVREGQGRTRIAGVGRRRGGEGRRGRTLNRRRAGQRRDDRRGRVNDVDELAGRAAVAAVVGRRPSPRHVVVLRARAGRGHVREGQGRTRIAGVGRRRSGEGRRGRTLNRRRAGQRRDDRRVFPYATLFRSGRAAVVAVVGRRPSPCHVVVLRAGAG